MDDARPLRRLSEPAHDQHGNLTTAQMRAAGLSNKQVLHLVDDGTLARTGKHVVRSPLAVPSEYSDLCALVIDCGTGAIVSGPTVLALHELDGFKIEAPFHITLPRGRLLDRPPHHIHTSIVLPPADVTRRHGIPVMAVPRALSDTAKHVSAKKLTGAYDSAIRDRKTTEDLVHEHIAAIRSRGRYGIPSSSTSSRGARRHAAVTAGWSGGSWKSVPAPGCPDRSPSRS